MFRLGRHGRGSCDGLGSPAARLQPGRRAGSGRCVWASPPGARAAGGPRVSAATCIPGSSLLPAIVRGTHASPPGLFVAGAEKHKWLSCVNHVPCSFAELVISSSGLFVASPGFSTHRSTLPADERTQASSLGGQCSHFYASSPRRELPGLPRGGGARGHPRLVPLRGAALSPPGSLRGTVGFSAMLLATSELPPVPACVFLSGRWSDAFSLSVEKVLFMWIGPFHLREKSHLLTTQGPLTAVRVGAFLCCTGRRRRQGLALSWWRACLALPSEQWRLCSTCCEVPAPRLVLSLPELVAVMHQVPGCSFRAC